MIESASLPLSSGTPVSVATEWSPYSKRQQLLQALLDDSELLLKNRLEVRHLMTRDPMVIPPTTTLEELTVLMQQGRLHHVLVSTRGSELLGIITDRDLHAQPGTTAQQLMTYPVPTVAPDTPLSPAITFLLNEDLACLPVMSGGQVCGLLSTTDLVLTLQCMLQLWLRLAQVLQHDATWIHELDKIAASLDDKLTAEQLSESISAARQSLQLHIQNLVNMVDLRADVLTGMSNRQGLEETLDLLLAMKRRYDQPFSLVIVVIDHYHRISEAGGETVVKPLVKAVARLVRNSIRESDFVARYRDDAFAVILTQTGLAGAETLCHRLQEAARQNTELEIKLRIKTSAVSAEPDESMAELICRAEAAVS